MVWGISEDDGKAKDWERKRKRKRGKSRWSEERGFTSQGCHSVYTALCTPTTSFTSPSSSSIHSNLNLIFYILVQLVEFYIITSFPQTQVNNSKGNDSYCLYTASPDHTSNWHQGAGVGQSGCCTPHSTPPGFISASIPLETSKREWEMMTSGMCRDKENK